MDLPPTEYRGNLARRLGEALLALPPRRAAALAVAGIAAFAALKLWALAVTPLQLAGDEAHYWEWSRRLDWAYYSKGPVVALLIAAGTAVLGDTELGVRVPALVTGTLAGLVLFGFAWRLAGATLAFVGVLLLGSGLLFHTLGLGMTTDPPVLLFWVAGTWAAYEAVFGGREPLWPVAGALLGLATLGKYTAAIVLPAIAVFLLLAPQRRYHLRSPWFAAGIAVHALALLPVLVWNLRHDWVNVAHNAGHVASGLGGGLQAKYLPELLGAQFGLVGPVLFPLLCWAGWRALRVWRDEGDDRAGFLLAPVLPLALLCIAVALTKRVYANWPAPLYVNGILVLLLLLARDAQLARRIAGVLGAALLANALLLLPAYPLAFGMRLGLPPERLPSKKLVGWRELGAQVDAVRAAWAARDEPLAFVTNDRYGILSSIAFYAASRPPVYCARIGNRRMNQYDVWGGWEEQRGRNALIVQEGESVHADLAGHFREIRPAAAPLVVTYAGAPLRTFHFFAGLGFDGRPPSPPESY